MYNKAAWHGISPNKPSQNKAKYDKKVINEIMSNGFDKFRHIRKTKSREKTIRRNQMIFKDKINKDNLVKPASKCKIGDVGFRN